MDRRVLATLERLAAFRLEEARHRLVRALASEAAQEAIVETARVHVATSLRAPAGIAHSAWTPGQRDRYVREAEARLEAGRRQLVLLVRATQAERDRTIEMKQAGDVIAQLRAGQREEERQAELEVERREQQAVAEHQYVRGAAEGINLR